MVSEELAVSKKIVNAIADLLDDADSDVDKYPSFEHLAEAVFNLVIEMLEEVEAKKKQVVIVGQIHLPRREKPSVVALGPFGARAEKATEAAGGQLAWDTKSGTGMGRYMVVPAFPSARAAWDHHRVSVQEIEEELLTMNEIQRTISYGPVCQCGLPHADYCHRHNKEL